MARKSSIWLITGMVVMVLTVGLVGIALAQKTDATQPLQRSFTEKIESSLVDEFSAGPADFIVRFAEQPDLSPAYQMSWEARGEYVYTTLEEVSARSQAEAKAMLDSRSMRYQTFIAGNELYVWAGSLDAAQAIAALPEVALIRATRTYHVDPIQRDFIIQWAGDLLNYNYGPPAELVADYDWGILDVQADQFWSTFGIQGEGILVANIDTGVQWDHEALVNQYKCSANPTDPTCWYDPSGICGGGICDNIGHGTHTMGTMVADDDPALPYIAGMAPNAEWIACKGCEYDSCSEYALNACADWILAPGSDPANRPHVVNNSWGGWGGDTFYLEKVNAWRAAGIFPAFSAGNGWDCNTLGSPGDYQESFGTASHREWDRLISDFSSKGPSYFGHDPYTKPNISAPGENICSSVPWGWDCSFSGTSMASPHSAGAVALLWSCNPGLVGQIDQTFEILQTNADPPPDGYCGAPDDGEGNYTYGYGYLDVYASGLLWCGETGILEGNVYDLSMNPIDLAHVYSVPGPYETSTDASGFYQMTMMVGTYTVTAEAFGYYPASVLVDLLTDTVTLQDFALEAAPSAIISGTVTDATTGWPLYASIEIAGYPYGTIWTDPVTGLYSVALPQGSSYEFTVHAWVQGYLPETRWVGPLYGDATEDFALYADINACVAPGYGILYAEDFEAGDGGFTTYEEPGSNNSWGWGAPAPVPYPGPPYPGPGEAHSGANVWATNLDGNYNDYEDGYIESPDIDLSSLVGQWFDLSWWQWLLTEGCCDFADIQVSSDGGMSWTTVYGPASGWVDTTWSQHILTLDPVFAVGNFRVRFHMESNEYYTEAGWYVDDLSIGACQPLEGGLVVGNVYESNLGNPLTGAEVSNDSGEATLTVYTDDPDLDDSFYVLFSPAGLHDFMASYPGYNTVTEAVDVIAGSTVGQDFYLPAGHLVLDPTSLETTLELGVIQTLPMTLTNDGDGTAFFEIQEQDQGFNPFLNTTIQGQFKTNQGQAFNIGESKDVQPALARSSQPDTGGGPDPYGYVFRDSNEPDGPTYEWIEIAPPEGGSGVPLYLNGNDDGYYWPIDLPWSFNFYGVDYNQLAVATNGALYFQDAYLGFGNVPIPGDPGYGIYAFIAHWWDDMYIVPGEVYYLIEEDRIIVEYYQVSGCCASPGSATWEVILFANGNVLMQYQDATTGDFRDYGANASIGIQGDPVTGLQYSYHAYALSDGLAICYAYPGESTACTAGEVIWLSEDPITGTVYADTSQLIDVTFDTALLGQPGDYLADLKIDNDTPYGTIEVPVTMTVVAPADWGKLQGVVSSLGYCDQEQNPLAEATLWIQSSTGMSWTLETDGSGAYSWWLDQDGNPYTVIASYPEHQDDVAVDVLITGGMTTTLDLNPRWLMPCVGAAPAALETSLTLGMSHTLPLTLTNTGGASTDFELTEADQGWIPTRMYAVSVPGYQVEGSAAPSYAGENMASTEAFEYTVPSGVRLMSADARVLLVAAYEVYQIQAMLQAYPDLEVVDIYDARYGTPTLDELLEYDSVVLISNNYFYDPWALGDVLADYVDAGGTVVQSVPTFYGNGWALEGRFVNEGYNALVGTGDWFSWAELDDYDESHPIMEGVAYASDYYRQVMQLQADAEWVADWTDDEFIATKGKVVGLNTALFDGYMWSGDVPLIVHNSIAWLLGGGDVTWLGAVPITGTLPADTGLVDIEVTFDSAMVSQPGAYLATLNVQSDDPANGRLGIPVTMNVQAPEDWGKLSGMVESLGYCDINPVPLLEYTVVVDVGGVPLTATLTAEGTYSVWLAQGTYTVSASADEHVTGSEVAVITAGDETTLDFGLRWMAPCISGTPATYSVEVPQGYTFGFPFQVVNTGAGESGFELKDRTLQEFVFSSGQVAAPLALVPAEQQQAATTEGMDLPPAPQAAILDAGDVLQSWYPPENGSPWGIAFDGSNDTVWVGEGWGSPYIYEYEPDGSATGRSHEYDWGPYNGPADSAFNWNSGMLWTLDVGNDDCLHEMDPVSGYTGSTICGPWYISQRGLAYDPATDTWFVGSWNDYTIYHIDSQGNLLDSANVGLPVSGLAYNPATLHLFVMVNDWDEPVFVLDAANNYQHIGQFYIEGWQHYGNGAGLEFDCDGNLWAVAQSERVVYQFESGEEASLCEPGWDAPWLNEIPQEGTVSADSTYDVELDFTAFPSMTIGSSYTATLILQSDDPVSDTYRVPVAMTVIAPVIEVSLSPAEVTQSSPPGTVVHYLLTVRNNGNVPDTYDLTLEGRDWPAMLEGDLPYLEPGEEAEVSIFVFIPSTAQDGDVDVMTVRAASTESEQVSAAAELTTVALYQRLPRLTPPEATLIGDIGGMVEYQLTLWNFSVVSDTIDLSVISDWVVDLPFTSYTLDSYEHVEFTVQVYIPVSASQGDMEEVVITATSQSDPIAWDASSLYTYAGIGRTYLPMIEK